MNIKNRKIAYILAFLIPMVLYTLIGVVFRLYPLSDNTILNFDMSKQLINFYAAFKHLFTDNNNLIYTFSKNLGGDMVGFSAYYLQNPYLLILFLFPDEKLSIGIYLMEILMLSTAGLTFQIFISNVFKKSNLIFSTAYAMMGYALAYFTLPIYFCNIILLPIVIMGLYKMLDDSKKGAVIYTISLAASIFTNYYLGYMLCLFLTLYFMYICVSRTAYSFEAEGKNDKSGNINELSFVSTINKLKTFVMYSVIGVMISCFDLVPVALSLRNQKDAPGTNIFEVHRMFRLVSLYRAFLPGAFNGDVSNYSLPYIYIGVIPAACVILYLINRKVAIMERIAALVFIGIMVISLYLNPLNTIWHAFNAPVGFAHRFGFYLSFLMLVLGYLGYESVAKKQPMGRIVSIAVLAITVLELSYNACHSIKIYVDGAKKQSEYETNYNRIDAITDGFKALESENSLYRAEKDFLYTMEDPMRHGYAGLSHNSSCEKDYAKRFVGNMGLRNQGIWAFYNQGSTAFTDSFLGVKYFTCRFDTTEKPYEQIIVNEPPMNEDGTYVYDVSYTFKNPYALPFGFVMDFDRTAAVNMENDNLFEIQNDIAGCFDFNEKIHEEANITSIRINGNVNLADTVYSHAEKLGISVENAVDVDATFIEFDVLSDELGKITYFYFAAPKMQGARIYVNGTDWDDYFSDWRWAIEKVGMFPEGETFTIRIEAIDDGLELDNFYIYNEDPIQLEKWHENAVSLGAESVNLEKITSSHIRGTFNAAKDGVFAFTIPYEKGWHIKLDGKRANQKMIFDALMAIDVSEGEHVVEMTYIPEGMVAGSIISILGVVLLVVLQRRKKSAVVMEDKVS